MAAAFHSRRKPTDSAATLMHRIWVTAPRSMDVMPWAKIILFTTPLCVAELIRTTMT
jgi:hypothetical protein